MFIRYLAEQALKVNKAEKKPRRNIQYKDLGMKRFSPKRVFYLLISHIEANAVARIDNLEFLSDVIPRTTTFKEYKERKARLVEPLPNGQTTLGQARNLPRRPAGINGFEGGKAVKGAGSEIMDTRGNKNVRGMPTNKNDPGADDYERYDDSDQEEREDVEMN